MLTKIKADNMQQQVDPMTGVPIANPQQQVPANTQGGRPQNFISQSQQQVGQNIFGGQSLSREYGVNTPQAPLYQTERDQDQEKNIAPTPETTRGKGLRKMNKGELMRRDISYQNDSLRKLPKTDLNHLPTFDTNTTEGSNAQKNYYSSKDNLKRLRKLSEPIRKKYGF